MKRDKLKSSAMVETENEKIIKSQRLLPRAKARTREICSPNHFLTYFSMNLPFLTSSPYNYVAYAL